MKSESHLYVLKMYLNYVDCVPRQEGQRVALVKRERERDEHLETARK